MADMNEDEPPESLDVPLKSVAIERIIEEMRAEQAGEVPRSTYNRTYTRHNRS